jgi:hypothetical protein
MLTVVTLELLGDGMHKTPRGRKNEGEIRGNRPLNFRKQMLRCNHCRTRRSDRKLLFTHLLKHPECAPCQCGGYHFPHRSGSAFCEANANCFPNRASREGATDLEVAEIKRRMSALDCPF